MQTKELNEVIKASAEVTSPSSISRIIAVDSNGVPKRISRTNLLNAYKEVACKDAQWVRIMSFNVAGDAMLSISNGWSSLRGGISVFVALMHAMQNNSSVAPIVNVGNNSVSSSFAKVRVVCKNGSTGYLDLYYPGSPSEQNIRITEIATRNCSLIDPELNAGIPEGYTAKEFSLVLGGG